MPIRRYRNLLRTHSRFPHERRLFGQFAADRYLGYGSVTNDSEKENKNRARWMIDGGGEVCA